LYLSRFTEIFQKWVKTRSVKNHSKNTAPVNFRFTGLFFRNKVTCGRFIRTNCIYHCMKLTLRIPVLFLAMILAVTSCKKDNSGTGNVVIPPPGDQLTYGDSVFYLNIQASDYIISPTQIRQGHYSGFPEGVDIDGNTGLINITKSETGLRYRITFVPDGTTDSFNTTIVISGINYLDGFYRLNTADSIARPLYNASLSRPIPGINSGSSFDDGDNCNAAGCHVDLANGTINLAQTVRNGVFGAVPSNNDRHEFKMSYRINDKSDKATNAIGIKLYYFDSINDVTQEVYDIISSREGALLNFQPPPTPLHKFISLNSIEEVNNQQKPVPKPRPPCIFILGR
jgi:hypothetical protein